MQYTRHNDARKLFREIDTNPQNYLIIHYSCESFYDIKDGHTPRITSIAVYDYSTAQTDSFSIHKMAEKSHVNIDDIVGTDQLPVLGRKIHIRQRLFHAVAHLFRYFFQLHVPEFFSNSFCLFPGCFFVLLRICGHLQEI